MKWKRISEAALWPNPGIVEIDSQDATMLKKDVKAAPYQRMRICAHSNTSDPLHEMIIVYDRSTYVRPHKNINTSKSYHIIEGLVDVAIFDDEGSITEVISMGEYPSGKTFFYRLSTPSFHALYVRSKCLVLHETTSGPFYKENEVLAPWSPAIEEPEKVEQFLMNLKCNIAIKLKEKAT